MLQDVKFADVPNGLAAFSTLGRSGLIKGLMPCSCGFLDAFCTLHVTPFLPQLADLGRCHPWAGCRLWALRASWSSTCHD